MTKGASKAHCGVATLLSVVCALFVQPAGRAQAQQALVLGGGGSRGLAHAGAIAGLEAQGWNPGLVVGTSIGAIVGSLYAAGLSADSLWAVAAGHDWRQAFQYPSLSIATGRSSAYPLVQPGLGVDRTRYAEGLVSDFRVNRMLATLLFDAATRARGDFDRLPRAFRAIATDFATGEAVVLGAGDLARAVRASMAVPGVFAPVLWEGRTLVDGGVANYLPTDVARDGGYTRIVSIDVVRPRVETRGMSPLRAMVRASRLILMKAAPRDVEPDVLILPEIPPSQTAAIFPADPTGLLALGRRAALTQAPRITDPAAGVSSPLPLPRHITDVHVDVPAEPLRGMIQRAFERARGEYDADAIFDAADALYATGMFQGIWPRVDAQGDDPTRGTLVVRADPVPPVTVAGGAAYESDRRGRVWALLRARPAGGPLEAGAAVALDEITTLASLNLRRPLNARPTIALSAGASFERTDVRLFEAAERTGELGVRRAGGAIGMEWRRIEPDWTAGVWLRSQHVETANGAAAFATGPYLRVERVAALSRVVGTSPLLEAEARFGSIDYRRARARGSIDVALGRLRVAALADVTASSRGTPLDAQPALGDEHLVPGLAWGRERAPVRLVTGLDLAWPVILDVHARTRLRVGTALDRIERLDERPWLPGAELGLTWWTPVGLVEAGVGVARGGRPRIDLSIGSVF